MLDVNIEILAKLADGVMSDARLTPAERSELLRIAQGACCKDSANAANVSFETIRARRKRIYRKMGVGSAGQAITVLLALALERVADRGVTAAERAPLRSEAAESA